MSATLDVTGAEAALRDLTAEDIERYCSYWKTIVPLSQREYYLRWLFAFMSVRARWQNNVQAYQLLERLPEEFTKEELNEAIHAASVGLWRNRVEGVWRFHNEFHITEDVVFIQPRMYVKTESFCTR